jgi:hypothetical protein
MAFHLCVDVPRAGFEPATSRYPLPCRNFSLALSQLSYRGVRSENREDCNKAYLLTNLDAVGLFPQICHSVTFQMTSLVPAPISIFNSSIGTEKASDNAFLTVVLNSSQQPRHV